MTSRSRCRQTVTRYVKLCCSSEVLTCRTRSATKLRSEGISRKAAWRRRVDVTANVDRRQAEGDVNRGVLVLTVRCRTQGCMSLSRDEKLTSLTPGGE
jgi:hypothetical protein